MKTPITLIISIVLQGLVGTACGPAQVPSPTVTLAPITPAATQLPVPTLTPVPGPTDTPAPTPTFQAAIVSTCNQYGNVDINGKVYVVQNGMWNPSPGGSQCLHVDNGSGAYTVTTQTNISTGGAPASYPFIYRGCHWGYCSDNNPMPVQVSCISSATSSWSVTTGPGV